MKLPKRLKQALNVDQDDCIILVYLDVTFVAG